MVLTVFDNCLRMPLENIVFQKSRRIYVEFIDDRDYGRILVISLVTKYFDVLANIERWSRKNTNQEAMYGKKFSSFYCSINVNRGYLVCVCVCVFLFICIYYVILNITARKALLLKIISCKWFDFKLNSIIHNILILYMHQICIS